MQVHSWLKLTSAWSVLRGRSALSTLPSPPSLPLTQVNTLVSSPVLLLPQSQPDQKKPERSTGELSHALILRRLLPQLTVQPWASSSSPGRQQKDAAGGGRNGAQEHHFQQQHGFTLADAGCRTTALLCGGTNTPKWIELYKESSRPGRLILSVQGTTANAESLLKQKHQMAQRHIWACFQSSTSTGSPQLDVVSTLTPDLGAALIIMGAYPLICVW